MKQKLRSARPATLFAVLAFAAAVAVALVGASASHAASPKSHPIHVTPQVSGPQRAPKPGNLFGCQARPINGSQGLRCYTPQQIQQAYGYSGLLASGVNGAGRTIVIIDAFDNPFLQGDLDIQDNLFGLPAVTLNKVQMPGVPAFNPADGNNDGWAEEETLDVLWAHAMAPAANITLVEAKSNNDSDILDATKFAVDNNLGDVISQSFGEAESCVDPSILTQEHAVFQEAVDKGMTLFASSGDSGASQFSCDGSSAILAASSPASDPLVTGVGGTTLSATDPAGMYSVERAWTEQLLGCNPPALAFPFDVNCSSGGFSTIYDRPGFQQSLVSGGSGRGVPDVAYNAGVNGGVLTHCGVCNLLLGLDPTDPTIFFLFGGTSAGSPQWAALTADADQMAGHDLGNINSSLYSIAAGPGPKALHDVIQGNNDVAEIGGQGYNAAQGWDAVTGLGTPNAAYLLPRLAH